MMDRIFIILILISPLFSISCKSQEKLLEIKLQKCIDTRINNGYYKIKESSISINFYKIISDIERYFISKNIFKNISKEEYLKAINKIIKNNDIAFCEEMYNDILDIMNRGNYNGLYFSSDALQNCPHYVISTENEITTSLANQFDTMDKLFAFGTYEQDYINELVTKISDQDFKRIVYRAPIIITLYEFIQSKQQKGGKLD